MLHLAFIFIILGAFITRYISFEGIMPIREGATESRFFQTNHLYLFSLTDNIKEN